jgi:hypothetical protein
MAKYKEGKTGVKSHENRTIRNTKLDSLVSLGQARDNVRGHENRTIQNAKPDSLVSLGQANTSTAGGSFGKWSRTPSWQSSEGRDHCQQDHHPTPYFSVGPQMPGPLGPPCDDVPTLSTLSRVVWTMGSTADALPPEMVRLAEGFGYGGFYVGDGHYGHIDHQ